MGKAVRFPLQFLPSNLLCLSFSYTHFLKAPHFTIIPVPTQSSGCTKSARGTSGKCTAHGGGRRCAEADCAKGAIGASGKCIAHGGGRRCTEPNCDKSVQV